MSRLCFGPFLATHHLDRRTSDPRYLKIVAMDKWQCQLITCPISTVRAPDE